MRQVACLDPAAAVAVSSPVCSVYISGRQVATFLGGLETPGIHQGSVMQAVQDVPAPFKDPTRSCGCAFIQMSLDEIVCRGLMDS